jgi:tRNA(Ile)-lysidine synthase
VTAIAATGPDAPPIAAAEFARQLDSLGPFESRPTLAIGLSGGGDSMALALLAADWVRVRGGTAVALTVDHGLRDESALEAARIGDWARARGIAHFVLPWTGPKPATGIMAAARTARYALMSGWCRDHGVLHLLLAHQQEDQIETFLLRLARKSGREGLAGMSAVVETPDIRLLRPLLGVGRARLRATLLARDEAWLEDPSNVNPAFARVRMRALLPGLASAGFDVATLAQVVQRLGRRRVAHETALADLLARAAAIYPEGWAILDWGRLSGAEETFALAALGHVAMTVGGLPYPPRRARLAGLNAALSGGFDERARTLGGCIWTRRRGRIVVLREAAAAAGEVAVNDSETMIWDDRFKITDLPRPLSPEARIGPIGVPGWASIRGSARGNKRLAQQSFPAAVGATLPVLRHLDGVRAVPHLLYGRRGASPDSVERFRALFFPRQPLAGSGFVPG